MLFSFIFFIFLGSIVLIRVFAQEPEPEPEPPQIDPTSLPFQEPEKCEKLEIFTINNPWRIEIFHDPAIRQAVEDIKPVGSTLQKDESENHMTLFSNSTGRFIITYEVEYKTTKEEPREIFINTFSESREQERRTIRHEGFLYCIIFDLSVSDPIKIRSDEEIIQIAGDISKRRFDLVQEAIRNLGTNVINNTNVNAVISLFLIIVFFLIVGTMWQGSRKSKLGELEKEKTNLKLNTTINKIAVIANHSKVQQTQISSQFRSDMMDTILMLKQVVDAKIDLKPLMSVDAPPPTVDKEIKTLGDKIKEGVSSLTKTLTKKSEYGEKSKEEWKTKFRTIDKDDWPKKYEELTLAYQKSKDETDYSAYLAMYELLMENSNGD